MNNRGFSCLHIHVSSDVLWVTSKKSNVSFIGKSQFVMVNSAVPVGIRKGLWLIMAAKCSRTCSSYSMMKHLWTMMWQTGGNYISRCTIFNTDPTFELLQKDIIHIFSTCDSFVSAAVSNSFQSFSIIRCASSTQAGAAWGDTTLLQENQEKNSGMTIWVCLKIGYLIGKMMIHTWHTISVLNTTFWIKRWKRRIINYDTLMFFFPFGVP